MCRISSYVSDVATQCWLLSLKARHQWPLNWTSVFPAVCSTLSSVIKRSEEFLAKMFLQREHAGFSSKLEILIKFGSHPLLAAIFTPPPSLCWFWLGLAWSGLVWCEWIETVRSFGQWEASVQVTWSISTNERPESGMIWRPTKPWTDLNQIVTN